ncbi:LPS export ABC transporter ATP-binding protein [Thiotrichales bacterium 19S9-12]|nr:LPS export ABC transporter ATP-binding protein [Thiotrichales bacterium 19S9-11]MCF6811956.1 LPS export ABC transporter ATP-binding protein [Thiotrichales bacterium 19S9-12]
MHSPAENKHTLKATSLGKRYKKRWVVRDVSIEVSSGEIVGLLGPNGAGKTTSFYMIVGLIRANRGTVTLDNKDITQAPIHWRARQGIGYLPQEASVFRKLTVEQNIMAILETRKSLTYADRKQQLDNLLNEFNLDHIRTNLGMSLSGGERRRTEIARALATSPQFILLDEPFAGVDPISVIDIKKNINYLKEKGIGVLITDHNVRETLDICERAYIVNAGSIISSGSPNEILNNEQVRRVYLGEKFRL